MGDDETEGLDEEVFNFAIQESLQDTHSPPCCQEANRKEKNSEDHRKIVAAIEQGNVDSLLQLSGRVSAFRETDSRGWLPLHTAAVQRSLDILDTVVQVWISNDLTLEELTCDGETVLTLATSAGLLDNVRLLLQRGASPHSPNGNDETPLLLAVRQKSHEMVESLIVGGAIVEQVCVIETSKWTATHEAAKVGSPSIMELLLSHGGKVTSAASHGVTPLPIAAEHGHADTMDVLIKHGGNVNARAKNGDTVLYDAAGAGHVACIQLLLSHGADPNLASNGARLPVHRAAYEGHYLALRTLIPLTAKRSIRESGRSPVHSAASGTHAMCLQLLIENGFDVNALLDKHSSGTYADLRRSALFFAVTNGDVTCAEMLLAAGSRTDLDPIPCILVAIRAARYDIVRLLLSYGADVNSYFIGFSNTTFPTALQYCLRDPAMLRLLLNHGYHAHGCFQCCHGESEETDPAWVACHKQAYQYYYYSEPDTIACCHGESEETDPAWVACHNQAYQFYSEPDTITFCEFVSVKSLAHLVGGLVRILLDYVGRVRLCPDLHRLLENKPEWAEIWDILGQPRSLQHLCRLVIRGHMSPRTLNNPDAITAIPFPPTVKNYLTYREYDLYTDLCSDL